jgi:hypothetical protein
MTRFILQIAQTTARISLPRNKQGIRGGVGREKEYITGNNNN